MALITFGNQNSRIFKGLHWVGNCAGTIGLYQFMSRCSYNTDFFDYKITVPTVEDIKKYPLHMHTFSDLMDMRIQMVKEKAAQTNKNIMIMYSGGIDSTAILISVLKNFTKEDKEKTTILCTPSCYFEFPELFSTIVKNFRVQYCCHALEKYAKDNILVCGSHADPLFGSNGWVEKAITIDKNLPYSNPDSGMPKLLEALYPNFGKKIYDRYYPIVEESLFAINSVSEFIYWFYFTHGWQISRYAYLRYANTFNTKESFESLYNFYEWDKFEVWALNNLGSVIPRTHDEFKRPPKEYISDYLGNNLYDRKRKFPSYGEVIEGNRFTYGVTENHEFLEFQDSLKYFKEKI